MTKWTLGSSYPIALTISLVPALSPLTVQAAPLNAPPATGILNSLCYDYVPKVEKPSASQDANAQPVEVDADRLEAKQGGTAVYEGDVKVRQGVRKFDSDYAQLDQKSRDVIAIGNIYYNDGQITVTSDKTLKSNLDTKNSELEEGKYQVHGSPVRGFAEKVTMTNNNQNITLEGAQYTTCPPGQEAWTLKAGSIDIDQSEVFGEAWNASLWLYDYPVFYFPYINFPIKDERKTGLLYPGYTQSSKNGMDITQPFYWNIAPNYDATITSRFMDRRGLMEQVEFRYMPDPAHVGSLYFENLADDKQYDETPSLNEKLSDGHRYLLNARHTSLFADNAMRVSVDYTKVRDRDYNYFNDFSPKVGTQVDNQLQQSLKAGYYQQSWNLNAEVRTYQILLASAQQPHELMPRINHNYYQQGNWYDLAWNTELTNFDARWEWYFGEGEYLTVGGFYKQLDKPVEAIINEAASTVQQTYINAPKATLLGLETEYKKYFDLPFEAAVFGGSRLFLSLNYTWTDTEVSVGANDVVFPLAGGGAPRRRGARRTRRRPRLLRTPARHRHHRDRHRSPRFCPPTPIRDLLSLLRGNRSLPPRPGRWKRGWTLS